MSDQAILISQCLQNDFVKPLGPFDSLPNLLHIGFQESRRLLGERPDDGPLASFMRWTQDCRPDQLRAIHIRDWHDASIPSQKKHLEHFGEHCIANTEGSKFAFPFNEEPNQGQASIVDSQTLNDFVGSKLSETLDLQSDASQRVGLIGVWTEAKVTFLAYELKTRYPNLKLAVCSALCAGSSRSQHFIALEQLQKLLNVRVYESLGDFQEFLIPGQSQALPLSTMESKLPKLLSNSLSETSEKDQDLLRYLFRDCRSVEYRSLDGGYSGNSVLGTKSVDLHGHEQVPHVVKIGPKAPIGRERMNFERIEAVLGNCAPSIADFADYSDRGALKYRYASMGSGFSNTFQKLYAVDPASAECERILNTVFKEQLGKFYAAKNLERCDLLEYYCFNSGYAPGVRARVEALLGTVGNAEELQHPCGETIPNVCLFYERDLDSLHRSPGNSHYFAFVHGDLNGANIIVDEGGNVWLIDFFHTQRGHILKDLVKLENDLLYIFTSLKNEEELIEACQLSKALLSIQDLANPLPKDEIEFQTPSLRCAYRTIRQLRSFYPALVESDRDPQQLFIAQLRYAVHTLGFDEASILQKKWALYSASLLSREVVERSRRSQRLRVDWLSTSALKSGELGITILPGRQDYGRSLKEDLSELKSAGANSLLCLVPTDELTLYGVPNLLEHYKDMGFEMYHLPIPDQGVCSIEEARLALKWLETELEAGKNVVLHCVGGLGRSGMLAACHLRACGLSTGDAIAGVREVRSDRAVETSQQEAFVREFPVLS